MLILRTQHQPGAVLLLAGVDPGPCGGVDLAAVDRTVRVGDEAGVAQVVIVQSIIDPYPNRQS